MIEDDIALDTPYWFYNQHGSDWRFKIILAAQLAHLGLKTQKNIVFIVLYNVQLALARRFPPCCRDRFERMMTWLRGKVLRILHFKYVISQGCYPPISVDRPMLWETYFLPPQKGEGRSGAEFHIGGRDRWVRSMERYGDKVSLIAVRGKASVNCLISMFPKLQDKVVDLGFVQPEFDIISEEATRQKQRQATVRILFVGREARRKGLVVLIGALKKIRNEGIENFTLTVISAFVDGEVKGLEEDWVEVRNEVAHDEVLKLFRDVQIFAMPSKYESFGLVFLESLANGCVTVVRDEEPQREIIDYGRAGIAVNAFSEDDVAIKMKRAINDASYREELALAGVRYYKSHWSQDVIRENWRMAIERLRSST